MGNKQTNKQTNKQSPRPKILRSFLAGLILLAGSVLVTTLYNHFFQPEEACAGCAAPPTKGKTVYYCSCSLSGWNGYYADNSGALCKSFGGNPSCSVAGYLMN